MVLDVGLEAAHGSFLSRGEDRGGLPEYPPPAWGNFRPSAGGPGATGPQACWVPRAETARGEAKVAGTCGAGLQTGGAAFTEEPWGCADSAAIY